VSSVDQDLVEGVSIWGVPGLGVDLFVNEVRTFDRHLPQLDCFVSLTSFTLNVTECGNK
jgi:hypothetical protein